MATKTTARKTALHPCLCSLFDFDVYIIDGDTGEINEGHTTECTEQTHRTFAQGHDAKLAGFLVRAELAGQEIRRVEGGMAYSYASAVDAALKISDEFGLKVGAQLAAAQKRAAKKTSKPAKKTEAPAAAAPTTREATIKVGRWTYQATIDLADGEAHFFDKKGNANTAAPGKFTEIA